MKCLFFLPTMESGGTERVVCALANTLSKRGHEIIILTINQCECFYNLGNEVILDTLRCSVKHGNKLATLGSLLANEIKRVVRLNRYIKKMDPDIVLSFSVTTNIISLIARKFNKKPLLVSERSDPLRYNKILRYFCKQHYHKADYIISPSEKAAQYYRRGENGNVVVIPNPIDSSIRVNVHQGERRKVICSVGRLLAVKNFSLLIKAFHNVCKDFPDYSVEIYGDGDLRDQLQKEINDLGLEKRVILMGRRKDLFVCIADASLFVMSSNFEGFPNALLEAMALGLPVISTDFPTRVAADYIKNGINGYLVPTNSPGKMSIAIRNILTNAEQRKEMGMNNQKVVDLLCTERIVDTWFAYMEKAIKEG